MPEQQNIEFKQGWHDDYLKWVCGFANAQGGVIFIGKDDHGNVVDVADYKKLMDEIPIKVRNLMGIIVEVNLNEDNENHFIEIITQPYSVPISLRGKYYYRSGSTKQELTGASLTEFLLKKLGKTWDDVIEPRASFDDINEKSVKSFLKASENAGRLPESDGLTLTEEALKRNHSSKPRNPIIAEVCFKGGMIDAWGRGTIKILDTCKLADLPEPEMKEQDGGFIVTLYKDILSEEQLIKLGLNERQIRAVLFVKEKGRITNSEYQKLNKVSKRTATIELTQLFEEFNLIRKEGIRGAGVLYTLIRQ